VSTPLDSSSPNLSPLHLEAATANAPDFGTLVAPEERGDLRSSRKGRALCRWMFGLTLAGYVAGAAALAWTRMPQPDEGHFSNAGYLLAHESRLAMPMFTEWVSSLDRHMYVQMPLYYVQLAPWIAAFGPDLRSIRFNSVLWGVVLVLAWSLIVGKVTARRWGSVMGLALIAFNYDVLNLTSARYDPMCAALSTFGVAAYLHWRERHLWRAVIIGNVFIAAAMLTHPFGIVGAIGFAVFFGFLDLHRLSVRLVATAAAPYLVAFAGYGLYVLQDLEAFRSQIATNAEGRIGDFSQPWGLLKDELHTRYLVRFAGWRSDVPPLMRVKVFFLVAYVVGIVACMAMPALRRRKGVLALVCWALLAFLTIAAADGNRWYVYLIHVLPVFTAVVAVWFDDLFHRGRRLRFAVIGATACWILFAIGTVGLRVRLNEYGRLYQPTLRYLQAHVGPGDLVMAPGEFGPGLTFADHVLEDPKLGYRNGRVPEWIVQDKLHDGRMAGWAQTEPALHSHITRLLEGYELVVDNRQAYNYYRVYRRASR
jgi:hypothetical protein